MNAISLNFGQSSLWSDVAGKIEQASESLLVEESRNVSPSVSNRLAGFKPPGIAEIVSEHSLDAAASLSPRLHQRIRELSALTANWDGEGAQRIKSYILADVVQTLKRLSQANSDFREPFLAPTFGGFIQIEWHDKKRSLEMEAISDGWSLVGSATNIDGKRSYFTADCEQGDFNQLERFYDWYVGAELIWPSL